MNKGSESVIKDCPPKKSLELDVFMVNSTEHLKKNPSQTLPKEKKKKRGRNTPKLILKGKHYPNTKVRLGH